MLTLKLYYSSTASIRNLLLKKKKINNQTYNNEMQIQNLFSSFDNLNRKSQKEDIPRK